MKIKHAHFDIAKVDTSDKIKDNFKKMRDGQPIDCYEGSLGENFDKWTFGSQSRIYILAGNDTLKFDPENLVQFSVFSARKENGQKPPRAKNNTFLNPEIDTSIYPPYEILILENWYVRENGESVQAPNFEKFSMNIHLRMLTATNDFPEGYFDVPVVVDPDTGNMGSQP